MIPICAGDIAC